MRGLAALIGGVLATATMLVPAAPARAATVTTSVVAAADTSVRSDSPSKSYGSATALLVDGSPQRQSFLRFDVSGIAGRRVVDVRLRMYQVDKSPTGGTVHTISSNSWSESITWSTKPAVDGPARATFGAVATGAWYEVSLGAVLSADGPLSLAVVSANADGADWASRETTTPPRLVLVLEDAPPPPPPPSGDTGLTTVADSSTGSSDPTNYAMNHRLAMTAAGRRLTVFGLHGTGVQLAWRDNGGAWSRTTRGAVSSGLLLGGTGTGDWPASIAVATGADGREHAWVMWAGTGGYGETPKPVELRHLSDLDNPGGPVVGPVVRLAEPGFGTGKADLVLQRGADGVTRGHVVWNRRLSSTDTSSDLVLATFTGIERDTPTVTHSTVLWTTSSVRSVTLVSGAGGARLVGRNGAGRLTAYRYDPAAGWVKGLDGPAVLTGVRHAATGLADGSTLVAMQPDGADASVRVLRFGPDLTPQPTELVLSGYVQPSIADVGASTVLVAVRASDGLVVSRQRTSSGWSTVDRVEVGPEGGGNHQWPNAVRSANGRLEFVVRGPGVSSTRTSVLAWARPA